MEDAMRNVQQRVVDADATKVGELLDRLASPTDPLWPAPPWMPMRLDRGLELGSSGGHGPIRYSVSAYEPGRRVRLEFAPDLGIDGYHELRIESAGPGRCVLVHDLVGRTHGAMLLLWPTVIRWLHEAVLRDLFDNAELAATGRLSTPSRHSRWVRLLRRFFAPKPKAVEIPAAAALVRSAFAAPDLADAFQIPRGIGTPTNPQAWSDAIFRDPPGWVTGLLGLRNQLVRFVGIRKGTSHAFDTVAVDGEELLLGTDDDHLDFRASIVVTENTVTLSSVARVNNRPGRAYLLVIGVVHPVIVRSMLARAARRLTYAAPSAARRNSTATAASPQQT
jgi:hypothetical protein